MWLQPWTPDFKPEEDAPFAPVWILLPGLLYHLHYWQFIKQILAPIGVPLCMDAATASKTRPSVAKVRVEIDLTKPQQNQIWLGQEGEGTALKGFVQKLEYEGVPRYCVHCRRLGHSLDVCRVAAKDNRTNEIPNERNDIEEQKTTEQQEEATTTQVVITPVKSVKTKKQSEKPTENQRVQEVSEEDKVADNPTVTTTTKSKKKKKNKPKKLPKKRSTVKFRPLFSLENNKKVTLSIAKKGDLEKDEGDCSKSQQPTVCGDGNMVTSSAQKAVDSIQGMDMMNRTGETDSDLNKTQHKIESSSSSSLASAIKKQPAINLVVDLNCRQVDQTSSFVEETEEQHPQESYSREQNNEDHLDDDHSQTYIQEVMSKRGISPVKRGRSRQGRNGKKNRDNSTPPLKGRTQN